MTIDKIAFLANDKLLHFLLNGSELYKSETNIEIIKLTIKFLKSIKCFERSLLGPVFPPNSSPSAKKQIKTIKTRYI